MEYEQKMDNIRQYFENTKENMYPIENTLLKEQTEYNKSFYIRMLCAVLRYGNTPNDMQTLYVKRIIAGIQAEEKLEDYMKKALELEVEDVQEFLAIYTKNPLRFYFCLDGMILLAAGTAENKKYELLAELVELLKITKAQLQYLTKVATAILEWNGDLYDNAKEYAVEEMQGIDFSCYLKEFNSGVLVDSDKEKYYYSKEKKKLDLENIREIEDCDHIFFKENKVIFENLIFTVNQVWEFIGCEEVRFINCIIIGEDRPLVFEAVETVEFQGCKISKFAYRFAKCEGINELRIVENEFEECGFQSNSYEKVSGGVFLLTDCMHQFIKGNKVRNCYLNQKSNYHDSGVFIGSKDELYKSKRATYIVKDNKFINCQNNYGRYIISADKFMDKIIEENNKIVGGVQLLSNIDCSN